MTTLFRKTLAMLGFIAIGATFAAAAHAQCASAQPWAAQMQKQSWHGQGRLLPVAMIRVSDNNEREEAGIVGFWRVVFTAKGSAGIADGTVIDKGFQQWHSDGTEILNSSKPPITGNFCLGVWKKTAHRNTRSIISESARTCSAISPATPTSVKRSC